MLRLWKKHHWSPKFPVERGRCSSVILSNDCLWKVFSASGSPRSRRCLMFSRFKIFRKTFYSFYRIGWLTLFGWLCLSVNGVWLEVLV